MNKLINIILILLGIILFIIEFSLNNVIASIGTIALLIVILVIRKNK